MGRFLFPNFWKFLPILGWSLFVSHCGLEKNSKGKPQRENEALVNASTKSDKLAQTEEANASASTPQNTAQQMSVTELAQTSLILHWSETTEGKSYIVERAPSINSACQTFAPIVEIPFPTSSYTDTGLTPATTYCYQIKVIAASGGVSAIYSALSFTTLSNLANTAVVDTPSEFRLSSTTPTSAILGWKKVADATSYLVERSIAKNGICEKFTTPMLVYTTYLQDMKLSGGNSYCYRLSAINNAGASAYSGSLVVNTPPEVITMPSAFYGTNSLTSTSVHVSWTPESKATKYILSRSSNPTGRCDSYVQIAVVTLPGFTDNTLSPRTSYCYRVQGVPNNGIPGPYAYLSMSTP